MKAGVNTGSRGNLCVIVERKLEKLWSWTLRAKESKESPKALRNWDEPEKKQNGINDVNEKNEKAQAWFPQTFSRSSLRGKAAKASATFSSGLTSSMSFTLNQSELRNVLGTDVKPLRGSPRYHCECDIHSKVNNSANAEWRNTSGLRAPLLKTRRLLITRKRYKGKGKRNESFQTQLKFFCFVYTGVTGRVFWSNNSVKNHNAHHFPSVINEPRRCLTGILSLYCIMMDFKTRCY